MKSIFAAISAAALFLSVPSFLSALTIWEALDSDDAKAVQQIISQTGFRINQKNADGETPLIIAAANGDLDIVKLLVSKDAVLNVFEYEYKYYYNAVHAAAAEGHLDVLRFLADAGGNLTAQDKDGWTPLILASQNGHLDVVKYLVGKGCYIDASAHNGETAISLAARNGRTDVVRYLKAMGAKGKIPEAAAGGLNSPTGVKSAKKTAETAAAVSVIPVTSAAAAASSAQVSSKAATVSHETEAAHVPGDATLAAKVVQVAKDSLGLKSVPEVNGKWFRSDCIGFVSYCFYKAAGVDLWSYAEGGSDNGCELVYTGMNSRGMVFDAKTARPGDIIFFNNTYDFNGNGKWDDPLTHVAVVIDKIDYDTLVFIHWASGAVKEYHINLEQPRTAYLDQKDGSRFTLNNWLRKNEGEGYPDSAYLASAFYFRFARLP
jgi:cell wall-associated NlpC family hydrolase